jgi:hypothetical protein
MQRKRKTSRAETEQNNNTTVYSMKNSVRANCSHLSPQKSYGVLCTVKNAQPYNLMYTQKIHGIYIMTTSRIEFSIIYNQLWNNNSSQIHNLQNCNFY